MKIKSELRNLSGVISDVKAIIKVASTVRRDVEEVTLT
jgi:hypothetical protein